jgi:homoserine dehydrogenase
MREKRKKFQKAPSIMKRVKIVLAGFGNVGKGFLQVLQEKKQLCRSRYNLDIELHSIFRRGGALLSSRALNIKEILEKYSSSSSFKENPCWKPGFELKDALGSIEPGVLVACTASSVRDGEPGLSSIRCALDKGWHVVTADKGPLVVDFRRLKKKAARNHLVLKFSGATAAALPAMDVALYSLAGVEISEVEGILNGTTNYILTRMKEGINYRQSLEEAVSMGIAEPDPSFDVEGWDTASKILIIANAALNTDFTLKDVKVEGISRIPPRLLSRAREKGKALKLLGRIYKKEGKFKLETALTIVNDSHPLFGVDGTNKGITFFTDTMAAVTVTGGKSDPRGAGASLLKDIINIYRES